MALFSFDIQQGLLYILLMLQQEIGNLKFAYLTLSVHGSATFYLWSPKFNEGCDSFVEIQAMWLPWRDAQLFICS
jgi:hypothetical protein